jgi:hypothetical protein
MGVCVGVEVEVGVSVGVTEISTVGGASVGAAEVGGRAVA